LQRHAWKADFNQCTGQQLISALNRASAAHNRNGNELPFVLIGHSKLFTDQNERSLKPFLSYIKVLPDQFRFGKLSAAARISSNRSVHSAVTHRWKRQRA
jgi:hypothetical protein